MTQIKMDEQKLSCKICNGNLIKFISFGKMPVANGFLTKERLKDPEYFYDMEVGFCDNCKMVQLINVVPYDKYIVPDQDGKTNYAFFSSTSSFMEKHFAQVAQEIEQRFLDSNSQVLETGSNDGIFLKNFKNNQVLGVEPSQNVAEIAVQKGVPTLTEFFTQETARKILQEKGTFRAIFSANVTLNIIDIHSYLKGINLLLDEKGVFITEDPYLLEILETNAYDQIYDEHVWYFSLSSLSNLFSMHGLEIFDAKKTPTHGGSMRVYVAKKGVYEKTQDLRNYLQEENQKQINTIEPYLKFSRRVEDNKRKFSNLLRNLKMTGKKVVGYAAASKGTIVQNYCNLDSNLIEYISDSTPFKQGLFSPGKHIPIVSPDHFHKDNPDYAVIFAWNHAKEIMEKETDFLKRGGNFIVHLPEPRIFSNNLQDIDEEKVLPSTEKKQVSQEQNIKQEKKQELQITTNRIPGIMIKKLNLFSNDQGYLFETIRKDDKMFDGKFGQVLVSQIYPGIIKGLHRHQKQTDYTTCIKGNLKYVAVKKVGNELRVNTFVLGEKNPIAIKIPPGIWHGYSPVENTSATVLHLMDRAFNIKDPDTDRLDPFHFGDFWTPRHG